MINKRLFSRDLGVGLSLGVQMAVFVGVGAFAGYKADGYFGIRPWGITIGIVIGSIIGVWDVINMALMMTGQKNNKKEGK